jgi:hypothetical protein
VDLRTYIKALEPEAREVYAKACETTVAYLWQIAGGHSVPSPKLAKLLAANSGNQVSRGQLRPDIWGEAA